MDVEERADVMLDALEQLPDRESRKPVAVQHLEDYGAQCVRETMMRHEKRMAHLEGVVEGVRTRLELLRVRGRTEEP